MIFRVLIGIFFVVSVSPFFAYAADPAAVANASFEPIPFFEKYKPAFFLLGKPDTKVQVSIKTPILKDFPLYIGYTQLMMWDLFHESSPFRDINYNPELFYRFGFDGPLPAIVDLGYEHESNGKDGPDSRSWNRAYVRYQQNRAWSERQLWWSFKVWIATGMDEPGSLRLPKRRGQWEIQIGASDVFGKIFAVNELILRIYGGGSTRSNPLQGGQEITYREKSSTRKFLLPFYVQLFHGYGENLLDADDSHWGLRGGFGF